MIAPPPIPREHGAWMMLYAPCVTGSVAYGVDGVSSALLIGALTAVFFAQNALGLLLRDRAAPGTAAWLGAYAVVGAAAVGGLLVGQGLWHLWPLGLPAVGLFVWQALQRQATRRQIDRSLANELATVAVMACGAAAAQVIASGGWSPAAALPWALFGLYFAGSVFYVKMRVHAARLRDGSRWQRRWRAGGMCGTYHILIGLLIESAAGSPWLAPEVRGAVATAFLPAVGRALWTWMRLEPGPPPLTRIGVLELAYAVWFSAWTGVALSWAA